MTKFFVAIAVLIISPLSAFACNGNIHCAMRSASCRVNFFTHHAGLLISCVISAVVLGVIFRGETATVRED